MDFDVFMKGFRFIRAVDESMIKWTVGAKTPPDMTEQPVYSRFQALIRLS
jgi:hypothetical protein